MRNFTKTKIFSILLLSALTINAGSVSYAADEPELRDKITVISEKKEADDLQMLLKLLRVYIKTERLQEACVLANKIISIDNNNLELYTLLSELYIKTEQYDLAEKSARRIFDIEPENVDGYLLLGTVLVDKAQLVEDKTARKQLLSKAYKCFKKIYYDFPEEPRAYLGLGRVHYARKERDKALSYYMIANELDKTNVETLYYLGDYHNKTKNYEKAIKYLNMSLKYSDYPNYKTHYILGNIYEKLAEIEKAKNEYQTALKLKPGDEITLQRYRLIEDL